MQNTILHIVCTQQMLAINPEDATHVGNKTKCVQVNPTFIGTNAWYS